MLNSAPNIRSILQQPSAFVPLAMSLIALALVLNSVLRDLATYGVIIHQADEGTAAHIWQLLMAGEIPILAFFMVRWLPRAPRQTLSILALQITAALASLAPVFFLHL